jgi:hypothetical protein
MQTLTYWITKYPFQICGGKISRIGRTRLTISVPRLGLFYKGESLSILQRAWTYITSCCLKVLLKSALGLSFLSLLLLGFICQVLAVLGFTI